MKKIKLAKALIKLTKMYEQAIPDNSDSTTAKRPKWLDKAFQEANYLVYESQANKQI